MWPSQTTLDQPATEYVPLRQYDAAITAKLRRLLAELLQEGRLNTSEARELMRLLDS
jgi:hypothetical protein